MLRFVYIPHAACLYFCVYKMIISFSANITGFGGFEKLIIHFLPMQCSFKTIVRKIYSFVEISMQSSRLWPNVCNV